MKAGPPLQSGSGAGQGTVRKTEESPESQTIGKRRTEGRGRRSASQSCSGSDRSYRLEDSNVDEDRSRGRSSWESAKPTGDEAAKKEKKEGN